MKFNLFDVNLTSEQQELNDEEKRLIFDSLDDIHFACDLYDYILDDENVVQFYLNLAYNMNFLMEKEMNYINSCIKEMSIKLHDDCYILNFVLTDKQNNHYFTPFQIYFEIKDGKYINNSGFQINPLFYFEDEFEID